MMPAKRFYALRYILQGEKVGTTVISATTEEEAGQIGRRYAQEWADSVRKTLLSYEVEPLQSI